MRTALGLILIGAGLILLVMATFVFREVPFEDRQRYIQLKANLKKHTDIGTKL